MTLQRTTQGRCVRRPVSPEPPAGHDTYDYADRFEIPLRVDDDRTAEQVFMAGLQGAPPALRRAVLLVHRHILGFRLGPASSPEHVLGWQIVTREPHAMTLETSGPLMGGVLVARRTPTAALLDTFVYYRRPSARVIWTCISPIHRAVAPYLMNRAASAR